MNSLVIIDMQKASFDQTVRYDAEGTIVRINRLSKWVRKNGGKVIFIQHDGSEESRHNPFSKGWEILDELTKDEDDLVIRKTICDSFYRTSLESTLKDIGVRQLIITGCATDFCVDTTVRSALSRDFSVIVPSDCHTTTDRPHLSAEKIIEHHNWIWSKLLIVDQEIKIAPLAEIITKRNTPE